MPGDSLPPVCIQYAGRGDVVVLALPRGGVPVGFEVARALGVPLDVFVVRKLGVPGHEELAMGALASGGVRVLNDDVLDQLGIPDDVLEHATEREGRELDRCERSYRGERHMLDVSGRMTIVVDDGLATGSSMRAAAAALRVKHPSGLVVGVPVAAPETCIEMRECVDDVVCVLTPEPFYAVGLWYADFNQTTDADVRRLMQRHHQQLEEITTGSYKKEETYQEPWNSDIRESRPQGSAPPVEDRQRPR